MGRPLNSKNKKYIRVDNVCINCHEKFKTLKSKKRKFCSLKCSNRYNLSTETAKNRLSQTMKNQWKQGILKRKPAWNKGTTGIMKAWNKGLKGYLAGKKHYNWKGGKSFEQYGIEFNRYTKEQIRKRDDYMCQECGIHQSKLKYNLHCHHIDYNKKNNTLNNLISLCANCHTKTNFERKDWTDYYKRKIWPILQKV